MLTNKSVITQTSVVLAGSIFPVVIGIFASSALTALCGAYLCAVAAVGMVGLYRQQRHFTDPTGSFLIHAMFGLSTGTAITLPVLGVVEGETAAAVIGAILTAFCVTGWVASIRHERLIKPLGVATAPIEGGPDDGHQNCAGMAAAIRMDRHPGPRS